MASETDLGEFVRGHIRSVWALELLLLLKKDPDRCWAPDDLVRELRGSMTLVTASVTSLEHSGLAIQDDAGCYRYAPAGEAIASLVVALEAAYQQRPVSIINLIARPSNAVQSLADAFKWKVDRS